MASILPPGTFPNPPTLRRSTNIIEHVEPLFDGIIPDEYRGFFYDNVEYVIATNLVTSKRVLYAIQIDGIAILPLISNSDSEHLLVNQNVPEFIWN